MGKLSIDDLWYAEVQVYEKRQTAKRNFVLEFLHDHSQITKLNSFLGGKSVCREARLLAYNINEKIFRRIHQKFKDGVLVFEKQQL